MYYMLFLFNEYLNVYKLISWNLDLQLQIQIFVCTL